MSRIGRLPIPISEKVTISKKRGKVTIKGPRGEITLEIPSGIKINTGSNEMILTRENDSKELRVLHGTTRAHVANWMQGVLDGHKKTLIIQGKGYQAEIKGSILEMQLGFSHKVLFEIPDGLVLEIKQGQNTFTLMVTGNDKQLVGAFCAELYKIKPVEPYNLIGFRYSDQHVKRKTVKAIT